MSMTSESLKSAINSIHVRIEPIGQELNELDGQLGDGDLGVTLVNGFRNMHSVSDELPSDVGMALFACAKAMTQVSGSSFGTLMATALMAAGKQAKGRDTVEWNELSQLVRAGLEAMISRGGASLGDKTVLDSLDAVVHALEADQEANGMLNAAITAADTALFTFKSKQCKIGRARIFGERTIGMDDPGMVAVVRLLACLHDSSSAPISS